MGNGLTERPCVLCGLPSTRVGEHVWPSWFIGDFYEEGPFETSKAGESYTARDSSAPLKSGGLPGVHVPMCKPCNARLNTTVEEPAKPVVRRLLPLDGSRTSTTLSAAEVNALAIWLLKVGLLSAHPAAVHDLPQVDKDPALPRLEPFLAEWIDWMRSGFPPPEDFSVFVAQRGVVEDVELDRPSLEISLPRVIVDGRDLRFVSRNFGFIGLNVNIVWHPGWAIRNAQVDEGRSARLWPDPEEIDFAAIPEVNPYEFRFVDASDTEISLSRAEFDELARTPLSHEIDPLQLFIASWS